MFSPFFDYISEGRSAARELRREIFFDSCFVVLVCGLLQLDCCSSSYLAAEGDGD